MTRYLPWLLSLLFAGLAVAKSYDEAKWERLAKARELRRTTEMRYEACLHQCRQSCLKN